MTAGIGPGQIVYSQQLQENIVVLLYRYARSLKTLNRLKVQSSDTDMSSSKVVASEPL